MHTMMAAALSSPPAQVPIEALTERFLLRAAADVALLRAGIGQACLGNVSALQEVERIGHKMQGSAAVMGFNTLSTISEAIERLAAGVVADSEACGSIDQSTRVHEIAACIELLAAAVDAEAITALRSCPATVRQASVLR